MPRARRRLQKIAAELADILEQRAVPARDVVPESLRGEFVRQHHYKPSKWEKIRLRGLDVEMYKNEKGFEQIAEALGIPYPARS